MQSPGFGPDAPDLASVIGLGASVARPGKCTPCVLTRCKGQLHNTILLQPHACAGLLGLTPALVLARVSVCVTAGIVPNQALQEGDALLNMRKPEWKHCVEYLRTMAQALAVQPATGSLLSKPVSHPASCTTCGGIHIHIGTHRSRGLNPLTPYECTKHNELLSRTLRTALSDMSDSSPYGNCADAETFNTPCPADGLDHDFKLTSIAAVARQHGSNTQKSSRRRPCQPDQACITTTCVVFSMLHKHDGA